MRISYNRPTLNAGATVATGPGEITQLLQQWRKGDQCAESRLFELLMPDLRKIAGRCFRGERPGHTLQPTALVNEAFLRLAAAKNIEWRDRGHFFAIAARVMRRCLIDHARSRPSVNFLPLEGLPERVLGNYTPLELAIAVDALLDELERESHQRRAVVELKFFLGLTDTEAAEALNLTLHTLQREWYRARRWLYERLTTETWKAARNVITA
ncbi:MAG: RNA polymerase subunit sigma-70 [Acidobacteria bacterium]|nr:MAG: RNA polymerase subunit sigma-70 [Acidobacteriota bacterium]